MPGFEIEHYLRIFCVLIFVSGMGWFIYEIWRGKGN